MTYLDFEKEYIKDRPTEPYFEDDVGWSEIAHYAEDNLQRAFNLGYCECFHEVKDIIKKLTESIRFLNSHRNTELSNVDEFLKDAEKFIEIEK